MDRRKALKRLGLSLGYIIATPAVITILQSCKNEAQTEWIPKFFSIEEGTVIKNLIDLILPKTENLPGANDVNVPQFIDAYINEVSSKDEQEHHKKGIKAIINMLGKSIKKCKTEDYDALLAKFLEADKLTLEQFSSNKKETLVLESLVGYRSASIFAYRASEKIGEEVLAYLPIPTQFKGCISIEEATGGKAWSL